MNEKTDAQIISRRRAILMLALGAAFIAMPAAVLTSSESNAETGVERRQERREGRRKRRETRREGRRERRETRRKGRSDRRAKRRNPTTTP
jgi:hypothetical protein